jgi:outer membrane protein
MKKICLTLLLLMFASSSVFAMGIGGKAGVTLRGGMVLPVDQKRSPDTLDSIVGYSYGGGFIYGLNNNLALEVGADHSSFDAELNGVKAAKYQSNDISLGLQYRFLGTAPMMQRAVPYLGAGVDVFVADVKINGVSLDVDPTVGAHLSAGVDLFLNSHMALNAEVKGVLATVADARLAGATVAKYNGSGAQALFGVRFFFN